MVETELFGIIYMLTDLARALHFCLDKAILGTTYNVGTQQGYSNLEILNFLKEIVDRNKYTVNAKVYKRKTV